MNQSDLLHFLKLLGHELRWRLLQSLSISDLRVQEMTRIVGEPQNVISYHLQMLETLGLVRVHPSAADSRESYYSIDLQRVGDLYKMVGEALHPALSFNFPDPLLDFVSAEPPQILFICTHNSARSQMAEGILRLHTGDKINVQSAGTQPKTIHSLTVRVMEEMGIDSSRHWSKDLDQYSRHSFDYVITVCDRAREVCPEFPGNPVKIHWSIPDPILAEGSQNEQLAVFRQTAQEIKQRMGYFLLLIAKTHPLGGENLFKDKR
jgi:ArsR family transcriptional regulator, arsenate/arsenite/antimonite-responsive transcriptional repressor / arsenate reductase (thioredoxin)